jgi:hypothetical protein
MFKNFRATMCANLSQGSKISQLSRNVCKHVNYYNCENKLLSKKFNNPKRQMYKTR